MTTRTDPPIGARRGCARAATWASCAPADLRFSGGEAAAPAAATPSGPTWTPPRWSACAPRTEGWAAGLYLAGLSLRGREDAGGVHRRTSPATTGWWSTTSPPRCSRASRAERRRLPAADLDPAAPDAARSATPWPARSGSAQRPGRARALEPLPGAARQPPRVVPLPPPLRRAAAPRAGAGARRARSRSCTAARAGWYLAAGDVDEAIHHAAAAGDLDRAADLIAEHWAGYERSGWTGHHAALARRCCPPSACAPTRASAWRRRLIGINLGRRRDGRALARRGRGARAARPAPRATPASSPPTSPRAARSCASWPATRPRRSRSGAGPSP